MKKYFLPNRWGMLLMFGLLLLLCAVAFAQAATGTAPTAPDLFGMSATLVALILGLSSTVLSAVFDRTNFSRGIRYAIVYFVSAIIAVIGAVLSRQFIGDALTQNLGLTILAVFGAAEGAYKFLQFNLVKYLQENVNAGKAAAPVLPK